MQPTLDPSRLVFVDESGYRLGSSPRHGWAPRGVDANGLYQGAWKTVTMIGGIALDGFRGFMTIDGGTGTDVFKAFVSQVLVPNLRPGDIVVMDNLAAHKNAYVRQLIREAGCTVAYTPPYSPEYNPIEEAWAKLKDILRRLETRTRDAFDAAVSSAVDQIRCADILAWFNYAGYRLMNRSETSDAGDRSE